MSPQKNNSEVMEENNSESSGGGPTAKVTPSRKAYTSVASDVSVQSAIGELLDNSLDSAALQLLTSVEVEMMLRTTEDGTEEFVYRDNAGGVTQDDMGVFLGLGRSREHRADEQNVGTFGIGAKKALKRLGDRLIIASRHADADQGWQYTVEPEWFEVRDEDDDPTEWEFPLTEVELDPGDTELRMQELGFDWNHVKDDVIEWIETTYRKFLLEGNDVDPHLQVTITDARGEEAERIQIESPDTVEWSYSPWFDGLHPRRFTGLEFDDEEWVQPITARVTVGLLRRGSSENAGTFIYCQNRLIESGLTDEKGGFGITGDSLNQFSLSQHKRLRIEIELFGDASDLPWNSDKSRIRKNHKALSYTSKGVYWWLRRMADRHMAAGKFGAFSHSTAIFEPYGADSQYVSHRDPEEVDLREKQQRLKQGKVSQVRIYEKPGKNYSDISKLVTIARLHAHLGICADSMDDIGFEDWAEPTYRAILGKLFGEAFTDESGDFTDLGRHLLTTDDPESLSEEIGQTDGSEYAKWATVVDHLTAVDDLPDADDWEIEEGDDDDIATEADRLFNAAAEDIDDAERRDDLVAWRQPRYDAELRRMAANRDLDVDEFDVVDEGLNGGSDDESEGSEQTSDQDAQRDDGPPGVMDCPQCGAELSGDSCTECGFSFDATDPAEGKVSTEGFDPDDVVTGDTSTETTDEESTAAQSDVDAADLTLAEFCRQHEDLFDGIPEDVLEDEEELLDYVVRYIDELQQKVETAERVVDLDQLTELSGQAAKGD